MSRTVAFTQLLNQFFQCSRNVLPRIVVPDPCKPRLTSGIQIFHRWKHSFHRPLTANFISVGPECCRRVARASQDTHNNARLLNTTAQGCLLQRKKDQTPDEESDVAYIEKELAAETKLSAKRKRGAGGRSGSLSDSMVNVGKFVPDKILELLDEDGTSLGTVNRSQAVALSQEKRLKLVRQKPLAKPWPLYKLMTGQELHQEQVRRNEKMKKKAPPTQLKEIKASWNIGEHDIAVRRRQLENWFSEEHSHIHARVTVIGGKGMAVTAGQDGSDENKEKQEELTRQLMTVVKRVMAGLEDRITLNGPPQLTGKNLTTLKATLRAMSAKEKAAHKKSLAEKPASAK